MKTNFPTLDRATQKHMHKIFKTLFRYLEKSLKSQIRYCNNAESAKHLEEFLKVLKETEADIRKNTLPTITYTKEDAENFGKLFNRTFEIEIDLDVETLPFSNREREEVFLKLFSEVDISSQITYLRTVNEDFNDFYKTILEKSSDITETEEYKSFRFVIDRHFAEANADRYIGSIDERINRADEENRQDKIQKQVLHESKITAEDIDKNEFDDEEDKVNLNKVNVDF